MTMRSFSFQDFTFTGVRALTKTELSQKNPDRATQIMSHQASVTSTPVLPDRESGWDYDAFWMAARAAGCGKVDLFHVRGQGQTLYLPASNYLFILPEQPG